MLLGARRKLNHLAVRVAVSEAAAWTGRRFYGGELPRSSPTASCCPRGGVPAARVRAPGDPLRIVVRRPGRRAQGPAAAAARLRGAARARARDADDRRLRARGDRAAAGRRRRRACAALGRVGDDEKHAALAEADVLCAPSLGGESFGMVLTEAFAAGTPVVASDDRRLPRRRRRRPRRRARAAARRDARWPRRCATSRSIRARTRADGRRGGGAARERYAWPRVAERGRRRLRGRSRRARAGGRGGRAAVRIGAAPGRPRARAGRARRLRSLEPARRRSRTVMRVAAPGRRRRRGRRRRDRHLAGAPAHRGRLDPLDARALAARVGARRAWR